jgi:hypothetical protein
MGGDMFKNSLLRALFIVSGVVVFFHPGTVAARQTVVLGSLGVGYDYWERTYDHEGDETLIVDQYEGDRREYSAWPEIELQSLGIHDTLSLRYAPVLKYDDLLDTTNLDHYLDLAGEWALSKDWSFDISNSFVLTDDPGRYGTTFYRAGIEGQEGDTGEESAQPPQAEQPPDEITQNLGRSRYWTNNLAMNTTYTYMEDSDAGIGYAYRVLRNDSGNDVEEGGYEEYDRHEVFGLWSFRFNPSWMTQLDLNYIKGIYGDTEVAVPPETGAPEVLLHLSQDLQEYRADLRLDYDKGINDTFPLLYRFRGSQYEDLRQDIWAHELTVAWDHGFDSRTRLVMGAGPSYINAEELGGEWGYNAYLNFTRAYQHGDLSVLVNKRYDPLNFTGSTDSGMTDVTNARVDLTYRFVRDLSTTIYAQYRYEDILNPQGEFYRSALGERDPLSLENVGDASYSRESYSAGASLDYTFLRWFVATVRYVYYLQDGDVVQDAYTDHRVTLMISASKELWR